MLMENSTIKNSEDWCISWSKSIHLYGLIIPGIALTIFGLTFNSIALYYFSTSRNFRRSPYAYYFSAIAIFDLLRLTIWFGFLILDYRILEFHFHPLECSIQTFSESVASSISAWLTVSLTLERCLAIFKPLQALTDTRGKRALFVIFSVILACCTINLLFLKDEFYGERFYRKESQTIICFYTKSLSENTNKTESSSYLTPNMKRMYLLFIVIIRVVIPFMLILTANIILFASVRRTEKPISNSQQIFLVRHGHLRQITPMIFFSSCILLLTVSPRYLFQFYVNFFVESYLCTVMYIPHLLKTLELFNYSLNVFISIVSGKHSRYELKKTLLCRTNTAQYRFHSSSGQHSRVPTTVLYQRRSNRKYQEQKNSNEKLSLKTSRTGSDERAILTSEDIIDKSKD